MIFVWTFIFFLFNVHAEDTTCFSPNLYRSIWPDFCLEHLNKFPEACSECHTDDQGNLYLDFLQEGSSSAHIDTEILSRLSKYTKLIPTLSSSCSFQFCPRCSSPVARGIFAEECEKDELGNTTWEPVISYKCKCLENWHNEYDEYNWDDDEQEDIPHWTTCHKQAIPHYYFDVHSKQFVSFLEQHLKYCKENSKCMCYWPHRSIVACEISDDVYEKMEKLLEKSPLNQLTGSKNSSDFPYLNDRATYGVLAGLFVHTFFYTQYRHVLLHLAHWSESNQADDLVNSKLLNSLYELLGALQLHFLPLYSYCLENHPHPKIYYERGMVLFHRGETPDALDDIRNFIDWAEKNDQKDLLSSDLYLQEGKVYAELGLYDKAVEELNKAIQKDPANKEAYFERAGAYFERGDFDYALSDFLASDVKSSPINPKDQISLEYATGLIAGTTQGIYQGTVEYVPNLLGSFYGLNNGLWSFLAHPYQVSSDLVQACQACADFIHNHSTPEIIQELVPELKELAQNWDTLSQFCRGELIGTVIGKYGVEIFAGIGTTKAIAAFQNLKRANNLLTFELAALDKKNRALLAAQAIEKAQNRKKILSVANLKIIHDRQGKHIPGRHNFDPQKSEWTHPNPQKLIDEFAGSGQKINAKTPGTPGYRERVNFKEKIGVWKSEDGSLQKETTVGMIIYAKEGVHIIPLKPIE
jgi:tetratricopeptide (TPR) repeat protein